MCAHRPDMRRSMLPVASTPHCLYAMRLGAAIALTLAAPSVAAAHGERVGLDLEVGPLRQQIEVELRARAMEPVGATDEHTDASVRLEENVAVVASASGETRVEVPPASASDDDLALAAIVIASVVEDAIGGTVAQRERLPRAAFGIYGDVEVGTYAVLEPLDASAYARGRVGMQVREGLHLAIVLDSHVFRRASETLGEYTGTATHLGIEGGMRFFVDDVTLGFDGHALVGTGARMVGRSENAGDVLVTLGGDASLAFDVLSWVSLGVRVGCDVVLDERDGTFALVRAGLFSELR